MNIDDVMNLVHKDWRYRWCSNLNGCACAGAANCSGKLTERGFMKIDWLSWVVKHSRRRVDRRKVQDRRGDDL